MEKALLFCGSPQLGDLALLSQIAVQMPHDSVDIGYVSSPASDQLARLIDVGDVRFRKLPKDIAVPSSHITGNRWGRLLRALPELARIAMYDTYLICDVDEVRYVQRMAPNRTIYLTHIHPKSKMPFVQYYTQTLEELGYQFSRENRINYRLPQDSLDRVEAWVRARAHFANQGYTCLNLSTRLSEKDWPLDRFDRLAKELLNHGHDVFALNPPRGMNVSQYPHLRDRTMYGAQDRLPPLADSVHSYEVLDTILDLIQG